MTDNIMYNQNGVVVASKNTATVKAVQQTSGYVYSVGRRVLTDEQVQEAVLAGIKVKAMPSGAVKDMPLPPKNEEALLESVLKEHLTP